ncbi:MULTISPECIES: hypothetical protein [unclassified Streptomyces]|uniref:hypothetical protein n=1 Tax=unclassified Streptomyces TaxID=2593676 RepID=UPI00168A9F26|nr:MULTISPECIES: hypothetical protein [unclassified Streptomyces]MBD3005596.1 hypothetical protein [Streptomyces sp. 5-10]
MQRLVEWNRNFRLWHYTVSYSQLLLRSVNIEGTESRVDILFSNVNLMHVSNSFESLSIDRMEISEARDFLQLGTPLQNKGHIFLLNGGEFYVQGSHCEWHEDLGGPRTPSRFGPLRGIE